MDSKINDLKTKHISDEVKKVDDRVNENEKGNTFSRGFFFYIKQNYLVYDCRANSFNNSGEKISAWKSTGIFNYSDDSNMNAVGNSKGNFPYLVNAGRMHLFLNGNYFEQNKIIIPPKDDTVINICCVYELQPVAFSRNNEFAIQNALFGAIKITKNANTSKYKYKGYGICFDKSEEFTHTRKEGNFTHTTLARNLLIFRAGISFSKHANYKANNIYVMGKDYVQKINDTTIYAEKMFYRNFTDPGKKFVLSLHYNGSNSYLLVNGRQELKFKSKIEYSVKDKLCLGNWSNSWTTSESEKTGYTEIFMILL